MAWYPTVWTWGWSLVLHFVRVFVKSDSHLRACYSLWLGPRSGWEERLPAVCYQLPFHRVVVCHGGEIWNIAQCLTECCVPPCCMYLPCPMHSFSVLNWSFVTRTVCATHLGQCSRREWQYSSQYHYGINWVLSTEETTCLSTHGSHSVTQSSPWRLLWND